MSDGRLREESRQETECESLGELLSAWLDGALDGEERERVEAHLRRCLPCARTLESLRRMDAGLREWVAVPPPPAVWTRLSSAPPATRSRSSRWLALPLFLLALFDGELGDDARGTGTWRAGGGFKTDLAALGAGLVLAIASWLAGGPSGLLSAALALPLLWLASLRLEYRFGAAGLLVVVALGALPAFAFEPVRAFAPAGALAALSVCQGLATPRLAVRLAGRNLRAPVRAGVVLAASFVLARPDLAGAWALVPVLGGAAAGTLATTVRRAA